MSAPASAPDAIRDPGRLAALHRTGLLDGAGAEAFDRLTRLASRLLRSPVALLSLVDAESQVFTSSVGLPEPWRSRRGTPLDASICRYAVESGRPVIIEDARRDPLLRGNQAVTELGVVAYAGVPITLAGGHVIGALCAIDSRPRTWELEEIAALRDLADLVVGEIERRESALLLRTLVEGNPDPVFVKDREGRYLFANSAAARAVGLAISDVIGRDDGALFPPRTAERIRRYDQELLASGATVTYEGGAMVGGERRTYLTTKSLYRNTAGEVAGVLGTAKDITERKRMEEALRASESRYRLLFASNPRPMWVYDTETLAFLEVNDAAEHHYGYSREEFLAMSLRDIRPPEDVDAFVRWVASLPRGLAVWHNVARHRRRDGSICHVSVASHGIEFAGRGARLVVVEDVTDRRQTDQVQRATYRMSEAAQSARDLQELYAAIHGIVSELMPARSFYIALHDPLTETLSFPYFVDEREAAPPAPRRLGRGLTEYVLRTGKPFLHDEATYRSLLDRGEVESHGPASADWLGVPLRTPERIVGVLVAQSYDAGVRYTEAHRDILQFVSAQVAMAIERKRAADAVRAARDELRALVQASPLAIVTLALGGEVLSWNPAAEAMFGWPADAVLGRRLPCVPPDRQTEFDALRAGALRGHPFSGHETRRMRGDGSMLEVAISTAPVRGPDGEPVALVVMYVDVTARRRAEEELRQSQAQLRQSQKMEAVGRLAGGIAHDFNNLLTAILSYSELLLGGLAPDSVLRADIEEIERAGRRAADLTQQLLAFSRRQVLQPRPINLNAVVGDVDRMLRRLIGEDVELRTALDPALRPTLADPNQLAQVLLNLAVNARDAMPEGGVLTISTANADIADGPPSADRPPGGRFVSLVVSDTGHGMARDILERIFEPFFTTKPVGRGTGLGLSTVYGIVKQSDGHIFVESEPERGTAFTVYLPAAAAPALPAARRRQPPVRGDAETVLLVEDDGMVRKLTHEILARHGYRVLEATDGPEALRVCEEYPGAIDLMITDVVMPRMSGRELVEQARPGRPALRVLYVSGYSDEAIARQGRLTDGAELLSKPFTPGVLTAKVREILERERP